MPISKRNVVQPWSRPKPTKEVLDYSELVTIDFSKFDKPNGKFELARDLAEALQYDGFWVVVNFGIPQDLIDCQFALGKHFFNDYSLEEKSAKACDFENGDYFGYKKVGAKTIFGTEVRENVETFNIPKFTKDETYRELLKQPFYDDFYDEVSSFSRITHDLLVKRLYQLFAIILGLDESYFASKHDYELPSDTHLRYMQYHPRSLEDDEKVERIWSRAHTDFGSLTLLFNQEVNGLQLKLSDNSWKYVKPVYGGVICNIGDTLNFWSGGYFKSTIHRVVRPPEDQLEEPRVGLFYFDRPGKTADIEVAPSPLLKRLGLYNKVEPVNGHHYVRQRVKNYHESSDYGKRAGEVFQVGQFKIQDGFD
ncbi:hypothetical protein LJB42_000920 [Komagataella kurtzmanii]|nr:hypothetical protein LJB42_000920 [Komagataella kurtzmanii]